jgi:hypothetical protein
MNQKGYINAVLIIVIVVLIGGGAYFVLSRQIAQAPTPLIPPETPGVPTPGPFTVSGEITCLTKKGSDQQTLECAIGLKGSDGRSYGLKNLAQYDPGYKLSQEGLRVEVSGTFSPGTMPAADGNKYDVVGTIEISSIKEIAGGK